MRTHLGLDSPGERLHPPQLPSQLVCCEQMNETSSFAVPGSGRNQKGISEQERSDRETESQGVAKRLLPEAKP